MKLEVAVPYGGALVFYNVSLERDGIYQAELISYEGSSFMAPPQKLTLTRSVRRWVGSYDRAELVEHIGRELDIRFNEPRSRSSSSDPAGRA